MAGAPKTGNVWLEKLLSLAFDLEWIRQAPSYDFWSRHDLSGLEAFIAGGDPGCRAIGKAIDHDDVLDLLAGEFGSLLDHGFAWLEAGRSLIVRYEALHGDPAAVLTDARVHLNIPFATTVERAIEGAQADVMRTQGADLKKHIWSGRSGAWQKHLSAKHLQLFRDRHASRVARLGYSVR